MDSLKQLKKGQTYHHNTIPGMCVEITDEITTAEGSQFVGQVYMRGVFKSAWLAPSAEFRFGDFTPAGGKPKMGQPLPAPIQELKELLSAKYGEENITVEKFGEKGAISESLFGSLLGLNKEPTQNQIHWVRENRRWICKLSEGGLTSDEVLKNAEFHARLFANGVNCPCGDPECAVKKILSRFPAE